MPNAAKTSQQALVYFLSRILGFHIPPSYPNRKKVLKRELITESTYRIRTLEGTHENARICRVHS